MLLDNFYDVLLKVDDEPATVINQMKQKSLFIPPWGKLEREYNPLKHPVMDKRFYPDKVDEDGMPDPVTRVVFDFQRLAVKRTAELCVGIPVKRVYEPQNARQQEVADVMERIFQRNRIDSVNNQRVHEYFASCEVMTLWYSQPVKNRYYGIDAEMRMRCVSFSPMRGDELYPLFDEYDDLIALSVQYKRKKGAKTVTYFDSYMADRHIKWSNETVWKKVEDEPINVGKIPAVYMHRDAPAWGDTSNCVYEIEWAVSRNGNYLRENSKPLLVVTADEQIDFGQEKSEKKEFKSILQYPAGSNIHYVTWSQATDALAFHVNTLKSNIYTALQLPDWSFENLKNLPISGEAMKQMFIDSGLKVRDERGTLLEFFDREVNVIRTFLEKMMPGYENDIEALPVTNIITPYTIEDSSLNIQEQKGEEEQENQS